MGFRLFLPLRCVSEDTGQAIKNDSSGFHAALGWGEETCAAAADEKNTPDTHVQRFNANAPPSIVAFFNRPSSLLNAGAGCGLFALFNHSAWVPVSSSEVPFHAISEQPTRRIAACTRRPRNLDCGLSG